MIALSGATVSTLLAVAPPRLVTYSPFTPELQSMPDLHLPLPTITDLLLLEYPPEIVDDNVRVIDEARRTGAWVQITLDMDEMSVHVQIGAEMYSTPVVRPEHETVTFRFPPISRRD